MRNWTSFHPVQFQKQFDANKMINCLPERHLIDAHTAFNNSGKNIFHFTSELIKLFDNTTIEPNVLSLIKLPFDCFYIDFQEYSLTEDVIFYTYNQEDGIYYSGAYIGHGIATKKSNAPCINIVFTFFTKYGPNPVRASIDIDSNINKSVITCILIDDFLKSEDYSTEKDPSLKQFKRALNIIFNALLYLSLKKVDVIEEYPVDASPIDICTIKNSTTKWKVDKAKRNLSKFSKIKFVGQQFKSTATGMGINKATHWRRGHWRNQATGLNRQEHKLIWIMPTIINAHKGEPQKGHVYDVQ